jgi:hypothetical protein
MPILFDTGSSLMYVVSDKCDQALCPQDARFQASGSGDYRPNADGDKEPLGHCYGSGCVSGVVSKDTVCFAEKQCLSGATFLAVDEASEIDKDRFSGIVGLSPLSDVKRMPAFVEQIADLGGVGGKNFIRPTFSIFLSNKEEEPGKITFGGYDLAKYAKAGSGEKDVFWSDLAHQRTYFWTLRMGPLEFTDGQKLDVGSKIMILDSGVSYALIPTEDFNKLSELLGKQYGVSCQKGERQESGSQVASSDCKCKDYSSLPALKMSIFANKEDKTGKAFSMPRETYMKDLGNGGCKLMLNPSDMQIGAHYGETQWVMGDQFMQAFYTIYDHEKRRVGIIPSANSFESLNGDGQPTDKSLIKDIQNDGKKAEEADKSKSQPKQEKSEKKEESTTKVEKA